ncbi:uncharacterized protein LOC141590548 [Silene latifolia]|uniref:uncharacterized protein LOC141590548 n=1 Tax=Silene latifolia TaxID=37657 RepID=UPI003D788567
MTQDEEESQVPVLRLSPDDVAGEIQYWSTAVYYYILSMNPPSTVISGFVKGVWQSYRIDRVSFIPNGIFLVRFKTKEKHMEVFNNGHLMFDNKPVIVKEWSSNAELIEHDITPVPIWMKLYGLDIKFCGSVCLQKISGLVGKFIRCDYATAHKAFLGYARVTVEVRIGHVFPSEIVFLDELKNTQRIRVVYD